MVQLFCNKTLIKIRVNNKMISNLMKFKMFKILKILLIKYNHYKFFKIIFIFKIIILINKRGQELH